MSNLKKFAWRLKNKGYKINGFQAKKVITGKKGYWAWIAGSRVLSIDLFD